VIPARRASELISASMSFSSARPRSVSQSRTMRRSPGCGSRRSSPVAAIRVVARVTVGVARLSRLATSPGDSPSSCHRQRSTYCCPSCTPCRANAVAEACASACFVAQNAVWKSVVAGSRVVSVLLVSDMMR